MKIDISEQFARIPVWLTRYRWYVLLAYVAFIAFSFIGTENVWRDDSLKSWFGKDSQIYQDITRFERLFGSNEDLYIVYEAKDGNTFSEKSLKALKKLHDVIENYPVEIQQNPDSPLTRIREVLSLINVPVTKVDGNNLNVEPFIGKTLPVTDERRQQLRKEAMNDPDLLLKYISADARYGGLMIKTNFGLIPPTYAPGEISEEAFIDFSFDSKAEDTSEAETAMDDGKIVDYKEYVAFVSEVRKLVERAEISDEFTIYFIGLPEVIAYSQTVVGGEMGIIFIGQFVLMFVLILVVFRHFSAVAWIFMVIIITVLATMGTIGWANVSTSSLTDAMMLMIILISAADAVHILSNYRYQLAQGYVHSAALSKAFSSAGVACFLTTFTTVIGFASLWIVKPSIPIANFGLFAVIGILYAFIVTMTLLPILIGFWAPKAKRIDAADVKTGEVYKSVVFESIFSVVNRAPAAIIIGSLLLTLFMAAGIFKLEVNTNTIEGFDESSYIRKAFEVADKQMSGTQNIDFMIEMEKVDAIYDPEVLQRIEKLQLSMEEAFPEMIVTSSSIVSVLKRINRQFNQDKSEYYRLPDSGGEVSQLLFLFNNVSPEERRRLIADDFDATRISFTVKNTGSKEYVDLVARARDFGKQHFDGLRNVYPDLRVTSAGGVVSFMYLFDKVASSQILSFAITLSVVSIILLFVFGSLKIGAMALVPNIVPIVITFGAMGWLGISLTPTTMILAPIILGIAVDDSIHFINKLKQVQPQCKSVSKAIRQTLHEAGSAICFTSLILVGGLLMMLYSSNAYMQAFGYLSALAIGSALLADLFLVPAILKIFTVLEEEKIVLIEPVEVVQID